MKIVFACHHFTDVMSCCTLSGNGLNYCNDITWLQSVYLYFVARDVPDIRFQMAGYPAVFYYPVPVPAQLFPETGYLNRIIVVHRCDL